MKLITSRKMLYSFLSACAGNERIKFISISFGVMVSFSMYGLLYEKVVKKEYGDGEVKEKFTDFQALAGLLCIIYFLIGYACHYIFHEKKDTTRRILYVCASFLYSSSMLCSSYALNWVLYPTQIIAKCANPIPILILTTLIGKRKYKCQKYIFIILIVLGVGLFLYDNEKKQHNKDTVWWGELLLLGSVLMDGLRSGFEERMRHESAPEPFSMMLAINGYASIFLVISSIASGEALSFIKFVIRYPDVIYNLAIMAVVSGIGQVFIYTMISHFGSLSCSVVTTTRKFCSVLFSVIVYGHIIKYYQWIGTALVFGGLFADIFFGDNKSNRNNKESKLDEKKEVEDAVPSNTIQDKCT